MRVISANVNGVRAAARRGGVTWLAGQRPAVLTLQEVRAEEAQMAAALSGSPLADWTVSLRPGPVAGRAGVAVLTPGRPAAVRGAEALGDLPEADGRWVEVDTADGPDGVTVVSCYLHTGEAGTPQQAVKYAFLDAIDHRLAELAASGRHAVLTGDLNICHRREDLRNWKGNRGRSGFLPEEQAHLSRWLGGGWVDIVRADAGEVDGPYTWWSWRGKAFDNDTGWRIDYQLATRSLAESVTGVRVGRAPTYADRWSDHAAVVVDYAVGAAAPAVGASGSAAAAG